MTRSKNFLTDTLTKWI